MKKLVAILLALVMVISMVACSAKTDSTTEQPASSGTTTEAPAETGSEEKTEEPAAAEGTVKLGLVTAVTGSNSLVGEEAQEGAQLAIDEINAAGGVNGQMIELVVADEVDNLEMSVLATQELLANDEIMGSTLARGQVFHTLACALLTTFPNTTHTLDPARDPVRAEPATIRRAVEFVDANAHRDIGLTEIAEAARLGVRGLQLAFRRHLGTTPTALLRRVRLENAHRQLLAADPATTTVSAVAMQWGFASHSTFTAHYRAAYGVLPSVTLRRR